ncbi:MAG: transporter related, partial [Caulobacteraceae bacterium]|nr:transporter related [Caulobacteraceae bacterium]
MRPAPRAPRPAPPDQPQVKARPMSALAEVGRLVMRSRAPFLRLRLFGAVALTFVGKAFGVASPFILGAAVDTLSKGQPAGVQTAATFAGLAIGWALIRFIGTAAPQGRDSLFAPISQAAQTLAATETFRHALGLSVEFHQTKRTGSLSRTIDRGSRALDFILRGLVFNIVPTLVELVMAAVALTWRYDWRFAAVAVATVAVYAVLTFTISDWRIGHRRVLNEADSEAAGRAVDALLNYETVKAFGAEDRAVEGYGAALNTYGRAQVTALNSLVVLNVVQGFVMSIGLAVMALIAGREAAAGHMGPGAITAAVLTMLNLYGPLNILGFAYREIRQSFMDMESMLDLRRQQPDVTESPTAQDLPAVSGVGGELEFHRVAFRHGARSEGVAEVSFRAAPGATVALVGPSGAGKTTLVRLALRFIDPQEGWISLDGVDLRQVKAASLRAAIALVPQDVALFNDTLGANIGFGRPGATEPDIYDAARAAELGAFIDGLPNGMSTMVGERGLKLSGGERQRVGIARALLANPRVLILDEATSALDGRTEEAIQATLRKVRAGRTTLVVAHRLS